MPPLLLQFKAWCSVHNHYGIRVLFFTLLLMRLAKQVLVFLQLVKPIEKARLQGLLAEMGLVG